MRLLQGIEEYLIRKRSGGLAYTEAETQFRELYKQVGDIKLNQVTTEEVLRYLNGPLTSTVTWRIKYQLLVHFFEFWSSRGIMPELLIPPPRPRVRQTFIPYIYTQAEIRVLLKATLSCQTQASCTMEAETFRVLILFLYGTGAHIAALLDLKFEDIDLKAGIITIRRKRFERFREIPIGEDLRHVLKKYLNWRSLEGRHEEHLFARKDGNALVARVVTHNFQRLRKVAGITRHDQAAYQPRMHDLRYTFAVHRITSWIRSGADQNRMLSALAAYMGQVGLGSTERYLLLTPERFRKELNKLSPTRGEIHWRDDKAVMNFLVSI